MIPLNKLINDFIEDIAGLDIIPLIELLEGKENVSEFKLADKLELTVNQVRNMLYKLHSRSLVDFMRKKDKRKGWYIYYWTFDLKKTLDLLILLKKKKLRLLGDRLTQKQIQDYFVCPKKCVIFKYEVAMENEFRCPECGNILKILNTKKQVSNIKKLIKILKEELNDSKGYLRDEIERLLKKKIRAEKRQRKLAIKKRKPKKRKPKKRGRKKAKKKKVKKRVKKKIKKRKVKRKPKKKKAKKRGRPKKKKTRKRRR